MVFKETFFISVLEMARANGLAMIIKSYLLSLLKGHAWKKGIRVERCLEPMCIKSENREKDRKLYIQ